MALISPGSTSKPVHEPVHGSLRRPLDANYRALPYGAHVAADLRGFTDLVGACADDADRDDLRAAGARLGLEEAGARPGWLAAGRAFYRVAGVGTG